MAIAITGTGMITSLGMNKDICFTNFCDGKLGIRPLQFFDTERFNFKKAYEISVRDDEKQRSRKTRASQFLCSAINEAIRSAELVPGNKRLAIIVGTGIRELPSLELWWANEEPLHIEELHFSKAVRQATGFCCSIMTISNACSASNFALGLAEDMLVLGQIDIAIVAGCDSITESMFGLSDRLTNEPPDQVRPFDRDRRGTLLGEGAAAVVLESVENADSRGVDSYASLRGVGMSCDAFNDTAPELDGIVRAIRNAHERAEILPQEVDLLMAHGTGTVLNDRIESIATIDVFGDSASKLMLTGLKSLIGHTSGASALIGVVTAIECLRQGCIPPTQGLNQPLVEAEKLNIVRGQEKLMPLKIAQVNAFGFGGVNSVAILEKSTT
ncbi:MAG: hypothetical protein RLZZ04_1896 [Cyanobacteriota bacterium]|jgi:3-oxoacyl-[acyl-carrier-protein] synthase II